MHIQFYFSKHLWKNVHQKWYPFQITCEENTENWKNNFCYKNCLVKSKSQQYCYNTGYIPHWLVPRPSALSLSAIASADLAYDRTGWEFHIQCKWELRWKEEFPQTVQNIFFLRLLSFWQRRPEIKIIFIFIVSSIMQRLRIYKS